ncbi:MAG: 2,6-beta-D-fructofuranosidase, partial [Planctomycetota bacterium]|nr:2,6-beta-D-fructofuranosidase [Planctomycetota bacterium]
MILASPLGAQEARPDILIADFEGNTYGDWKTEGEAFGKGPAKGTLPRQMRVTGFKGKGLVNSFLRGDGTTGKLTSPPIKIERKYLTFLVGGGGHRGKTCMNLLVDGKVVHTITGANTRPGGSEELMPAFWDVSALAGKDVTLQIVDAATGGWGHVNVDHIVQSDTKPKAPALALREKTITVENKYLVFPIQNGRGRGRLELYIGDQKVRQYGLNLATSEESTDWYAFFT